jgi:hypothetical protein
MERGLEYPLRQVDTGLAAAASQLGLVANRARNTRPHLAHLWDHQALHPRGSAGHAEGPAMQKAREQHGELHTTSRAAPLSAMLLKDQDARGHIAARAEAGPHDVS